VTLLYSRVSFVRFTGFGAHFGYYQHGGLQTNKPRRTTSWRSCFFVVQHGRLRDDQHWRQLTGGFTIPFDHGARPTWRFFPRTSLCFKERYFLVVSARSRPRPGRDIYIFAKELVRGVQICSANSSSPRQHGASSLHICVEPAICGDTPLFNSRWPRMTTMEILKEDGRTSHEEGRWLQHAIMLLKEDGQNCLPWRSSIKKVKSTSKGTKTGWLREAPRPIAAYSWIPRDSA
jgi:hypothetical protein